jgi:hypothetical protein
LDDVCSAVHRQHRVEYLQSFQSRASSLRLIAANGLFSCQQSQDLLRLHHLAIGL